MRSRLIYAAVGAGAGALVAWAITADIYEKRIKQERAWVLDELETRVNNLEFLNIVEAEVMDGQTEFVMPIEEDSTSEIEESESVNSLDSLDAVEAVETVEETRSNLQHLIDQYTADPDAQAEFKEMVSQVPSDSDSTPFVISRNDFAYDDEGQSYEKITLTYYPRDRVLLDDEEEPMNHIPGVVGWRNLSRFGDSSEDANVVFIRNRKMETDFEVVKDDENPLPLHVKYGMEKEEFRANKAAGLIKLRQEDE